MGSETLRAVETVTAGTVAVGMVGVGRASSAVATALEGAGHHVVAYFARSAESAGHAVRRFPAAVAGSPAQVAAACDVLLLGVPDDALESVARDLAADLAGGTPLRGKTVVHLSGRYGLAVLAPLHALGAARAAIHPIMTLPGGPDDATRLRGASFGVTADPAAVAVAAALVAAMGGTAVDVEEDGRVAYHAALTLAANFSATLVAAAADLLRQVGVHDPARALGPLVHASIAGVLADGERAMTGPVRRGDAGTVRAHLDAIAARAPGATGQAYAAVGALTVERLVAAGVVAGPSLDGVVVALAGPSPR